jgi:hypothetical protein
MKSFIVSSLGSILALFLLQSPAIAVTTTFFGEDQGLGEAIPLSSFPNATAARNNFLSKLVGVGTESFESFAEDTLPPILLTFPGAATATLSGSGNINVVAAGSTNGAGRYATDGTHYFDTSSSALTITFDTAVAAFGFMGVDIGDFNGQVTVTTAGGLNQLFNVGNTIDGPGGSVLFWGLISTTDTFTGITFGNTAAGADFFGFDQMTIGSPQQVQIPVPEPSAIFLLSTGILSLGVWLRKKKSRAKNLS